MIFNALEFVDQHSDSGSTEPAPTNPGEGQQAIVPEVTISKVDDKTSKVTLTAEMPHPGYGLKIDEVKLEQDKLAIVKYSIVQPDPDMMYPMVITKVTAEAAEAFRKSKPGVRVSWALRPVARPVVTPLNASKKVDDME